MREGIKKGCSIFASKRGNAIIDSITLVIVLFVFVLIVFFGNMVFDDVNDDIQQDTSFDNSTKTKVNDLNTRYPTFFDYLFLFIFILLWALFVVASFVVDTHPIFFIFTFILMVAVFISAAMLGNSYEELTADGELLTYVADYPIIDWFMTNLLTVLILVAASVMIALFMKNRIQ